ncbi:MAG: winged helix-turn-helix transcriptional regulator [Bacteroidia bacterium]|nr:winged helix-turn-helix transcriptional regulator [Bacteroidia bacterium]
MKSKKVAQFSADFKVLATGAKAIGHPARVAILKFLLEHNNQTCKSIVEQLPFSQSTVSQHLAELKQAGFIEGNSYKTSMIYTVSESNINAFKKNFEAVFGKPEEKRQLSMF